MTDKVSKEKRSAIMSKIKSSGTKPELALKSMLDELPYVFIYQPKIEYKPDFLAVGKRTVLFLDGGFWHGEERIPFISGPFWVNKILRNMARDEEANMYYTSYGWCVFRIWESAINKIERQTLKAYISAVLAPDKRAPGVRYIR